MVHQVKFKYFQMQAIQVFSLTDRLPFSLMTFRGNCFFFSWRVKKDSKSVSIASFAALTEEDIDIICQRGFNIIKHVFFYVLVSSVHFYFLLETHVTGVIV